jgi:hypothetical protein
MVLAAIRLTNVLPDVATWILIFLPVLRLAVVVIVKECFLMTGCWCVPDAMMFPVWWFFFFFCGLWMCGFFFRG